MVRDLAMGKVTLFGMGECSFFLLQHLFYFSTIGIDQEKQE
jgi:hypothetical protein